MYERMLEESLQRKHLERGRILRGVSGLNSNFNLPPKNISDQFILAPFLKRKIHLGLLLHIKEEIVCNTKPD